MSNVAIYPELNELNVSTSAKLQERILEIVTMANPIGYNFTLMIALEWQKTVEVATVIARTLKCAHLLFKVPHRRIRVIIPARLTIK